VKLNPATVPNLFEKAPKPISPRVHAWLDVAVTSYFAAAGAFFWARGMVAGVSLMTDYYGTGEKPISFKMHGTLDVVQAATAATAPLLMGFAGEREALFFYGQAANEVGVVAMTDWDAGEREDEAIDYAA